MDECLNVFWFAHLSVEEYLETQQVKVNSHTEIAKICLSLVCYSRSWADYDITITTRGGRYHDCHLLLYTAIFWPWHLNRCNDSCQIQHDLWEAFVSEATFRHWIDYHRLLVEISYPKDVFWRRLEPLQKEGWDSLLTVCVFGFRQMLASISRSQLGSMNCIKLNFPTRGIFEFLQRHRVHRLLVCASRFGDLDIAQRLLDVGVDASVASGYAEAPLHVAAKNGHATLARLLLDRSADVSAASSDSWTLLHLSEKKGHKALALLLVDRGADVAVTNRYGTTPLHGAVQNGNEALVKLLVERGADVSAARLSEMTPLHLTAQSGNEALARLLVDRGADVSAGSSNRWTPLHLAAKNGHVPLARLLLDRGANLSVVDSNGSIATGRRR